MYFLIQGMTLGFIERPLFVGYNCINEWKPNLEKNNNNAEREVFIFTELNLWRQKFSAKAQQFRFCVGHGPKMLSVPNTH